MTTVTATRPDGTVVAVPMYPSAAAVLDVLRARPGGACARTFADFDMFRFGARIHELRKLGFDIADIGQCTVHMHVHHVPAYQLKGFNG